jgi:hypothetical protein
MSRGFYCNFVTFAPKHAHRAIDSPSTCGAERRANYQESVGGLGGASLPPSAPRGWARLLPIQIKANATRRGAGRFVPKRPQGR